MAAENNYSQPCLVCGETNSELWAKKNDYTAVKCLSCELIWIDPVPTTEELNQFYGGYYQNRVEEVKLSQLRKIMYILDKNWLEQFIQSGAILDLGCSDGSFLSTFGPQWEKHGIEIGKDAVKEATTKNIKVLEGSEEKALCFNKKFDCVTMRGTIEHFPNPRNVIKIISQVLKSGGYFFVTATPDAGSFCANLYREKWNQFEPPAHLFYFNVKNLTKLLEQFGFKKVAQHHFYPETPYANLEEDHQRVLNDLQLIKKGLGNQVKKSAAFWGNMMTVLYKKE